MAGKNSLFLLIILGHHLLFFWRVLAAGSIMHSKIIVKYDFYPLKKEPKACLPTRSWNWSRHPSGDSSLFPTLALNESIRTSNLSLRISCIYSQPLHWILDVPQVSLGKLRSYYLHPREAKGSTRSRYHNCITFNDLGALSGTVRCQSLGAAGAEIFIENGAQKDSRQPWARSGLPERLNLHVWGNCSKVESRALLLRYDNQNVVPCKVQVGTLDRSSLEPQLFENPARGTKKYLNGTTQGLWQPVVLNTQSNYNPHRGFQVDTPLSPNSTYRCLTEYGNNESDCIDFAVFSEKDDRVEARIELIKGDYGEQTSDGLRCSVDDSELNDLSLALHIVTCNTKSTCLKANVAGFHRPYKTFPDANCRRTKFSNRTGCEIGLTGSSEGLVYCHGISLKNHKYVEKFDYLFKGQDDDTYLVSKGVPAKAVITLSEEKTPRTGFARSFHCKASTKLLFPSVNITMKFGSGETATLHVHAWPNNYTQLETSLYEISDAFYPGGGPKLQVNIDVKTSDLTLINCSAAFTHDMSWATGHWRKIIGEYIPSPSLTPTELIVISVVFGIVALLAVATAAVIFWRYRKNKMSTRGLTAAEIEAFRFGNTAAGVLNASNATLHLTTLVGNDGVLNVNALGFPAQYQIPWNHLEIYKSEILGEGQFACCFRGKFNGTIVAVKMLKSHVQTEDFKNYLNEVKLMAYIGQHPNVIQFYGAVIEKLEQKIAPVVVEMSPYGNLTKFLQGAAGGGNRILGDRDLISFCAQIASGMEYLSHRNVIHGDLAARNVLLFEGLTVKITDFGLSKNLYESSFYSRRHQQLQLPWRWMSPEALKYLMFSVHSDIWAFGVTAWEIFTIGQVPFAGLSWTTEFMRQVTDEGLRLHKPDRATDKIYNFLNLCWNTTPLDRPPFSEIKAFFLRLLSSDYEFAPA